MLLPKQSPPVVRKTNVETNVKPKGVKPQLTCACNERTHSIWCIIGKSVYNTGQTC
ncbi:MAG: hypothetical protein GX575_28490 [Candidatus Anammoximicrobium sp.]|nr:hypothetical protein [Candidatus Anammoximicrobium sp.]